MSQFDADAYFANAAANSPISQRIRNLEATTAAKLQGLEAIKRRKEIEIAGPLASFNSGAGALVETAGVIEGLSTGDMENSLRQLGAKTQQYYEDRKPVSLVVEEGRRQLAMDAETSTLGKLGVGFVDTVTNPELALNMFAANIPTMIPGGVVGRGVGVAGKALGVADDVLKPVITGAALTTAGAQQGADVAGGNYDELMAKPQEIWDADPEFQALSQLVGPDKAKHTIALSQARKTMAAAGAVSLATQFLPGGRILEDVVAGSTTLKGGVVKGLVKGGAGEMFQEGLEEGGGALVSNLTQQAVDPNQDTLEGVGEAAGLGAAGGLLLGAPGGAASGAGSAAKNIMAKGAEVQAQKKVAEDTFNAALDSGDVSELTNPEKVDTYNPGKAAQAHIIRALKEDASPEQQQSARDGMAKLVEEQNARIVAAQAKVDSDPKDTKAADALLAEQRHQEVIQVAATMLQNSEIAKEAPETPETKAAMFSQIQDDQSPDGDAAAGKLVKMLMMQSGDLDDNDADTVSKLADNARFTPEQQTFIRAFSDARTKTNAMKSTDNVQMDIIQGGAGFKGLSQYVSDVGRALLRGDSKAARDDIHTLSRFHADHVQKETLARQGYEATRRNTETKYLVKATDGWVLQDTAPDNWSRERNGGLELSAKSGKLVRAIGVENEAIAATTQQLKASFKVGRAKVETPVTKAPVAPVAAPEVVTETPPTGDPREMPPAEGSLVKPTVPEVTETVKTPAKEVVTVESFNKAIAEDAATTPTPPAAEVVEKPKTKGKKPKPTFVVNYLDGTSADVEVADEFEMFGERFVLHRPFNSPKKGWVVSHAGTSSKVSHYPTGTKIFTVEQAKERLARIGEVRFKEALNKELQKQALNKTVPTGAAKEESDVETKKKPGIQEVSKEDEDVRAEQEPSVDTSESDPRDDRDDEGYIPNGDEDGSDLGDYYDELGEGVPLEEVPYEAEGELPVEAGEQQRAGRFEITPSVQDEEGTTIGWDIQDSDGNGLEVEAEFTEDGEFVRYVNVDNDKESWATWDDLVADLEKETLDAYEDGAGVLNVLKLETPIVGNIPNAVYQTTHLIANYFRQKLTRKGSTAQALIQYADLKDQLFNTDKTINMAVLKSLVKQKTFTEGQTNYLQTLGLFINITSPSIRSMLEGEPKTASGKPKKANREYFFERYMEFFQLGEDGQPGTVPLDENLITAIAVAGFGWLAENGGKSEYLPEFKIRSLLGIGSEDFVNSEAWTALSKAGDKETLLIQAWGKRVYKMLGYEAVPGTPKNEVVKFQLALGSAVAGMLQTTGVIEKHYVDNDIFVQALSGTDAIPDSGVEGLGVPFLRLRRFEDELGNNTPTDLVQRIHREGKGTAGILDKVFGTEDPKKPPQFKPARKEQVRIKKTDQVVPVRARKIAASVNKEAYTFRADMRIAREALDQEVLQGIHGWKDLSGRLMHKLLQAKQIASNNKILQEMEDMAEFEAMAGDRKFYLTNKMAQTQRNNFAERLFNLQDSKIHRHNASKEAWASTFNPKDPSTDLYKYFRLAVAQGLGIKVDKQSHETSLGEFDALIKDPVIVAAVEALQSIEPGKKLAPKQQAAIALAVKQTKGKAHGLDALVNLANFLTAKNADGVTEFTTHIMFEVDGVSNGVALTTLQLGQLNNVLGPAFGMVSKGQTYTGYTDFRGQPGSKDVYEQLAISVNGHLEDVFRKFQTMGHNVDMEATMKPLYYFMGTFAKDGDVTAESRDLVKYPILQLIYGGSTKNIVKAMAGAFSELLLQRIEDEANMDGTDEQRLEAIHKSIAMYNTMLPSDVDAMVMPATLEQALETKPTNAQRQAVETEYSVTFGAAISAALEDQYKGIITAQKQINRAGQVAWAMYDAARTALITKRTDALMASGDMAQTPSKSGVGTPRQVLNPIEIAAIEKELEALKPRFHTWLSQQSGDLAEGIDITKQGLKLADYKANPMYTQQFDSRTALPTFTDGVEASHSKPSKGAMPVLENPGVRTMSIGIHSSDSAISMLATELFALLNLHDAEGMGISQMGDVARAMNKATLQVMSEWSLPMAVRDMLQRSSDAQDALAATHSELTEVFNNVKVGAPGFEEDVDSFNELYKMSQMALGAELAKLDYLLSLEIMDQYTFEGGEYILTAEDKAALQKRRDAIAAEMKKESPAAKDKTSPEFDKLPEHVEGQRTMTYAGIGSRETPPEILAKMREHAAALAARGYTLMSGGAKGADQAFGFGAKGKARVFTTKDANDQTRTIAREIHPAPKALKDYILDLMARNTNQIFGANLDTPVDFVLTWTPDGVESHLDRTQKTGGTGQAIEMASRKGVPVINMANEGWEAKLDAILGVAPVAATPAQKSVWGELGGNSRITNNRVQNYLAGLQGKPGRVGGLLAVLSTSLEEAIKSPLQAHEKDLAKWHLVLAKQLGKSKAAMMPVRAIQKDTPVLPHEEEHLAYLQTANGWYDPVSKSISIKSTEFTHSKMKSELVLHEVLHGVLFDKINSYLGQPAPSDPAELASWEAIQDLEELYKGTLAFRDANPEVAEYFAETNAFANVHEMISWGMTNHSFQTKVLKAMATSDGKGKSLYKNSAMARIKSGLDAFFHLITTAIYGDKAQDNLTTGMSLLASSVTLLLEQEEKASTRRSDKPQAPLAMQSGPDTYTSNEVFEALGKIQGAVTLSPVFQAHLQSVLSRVVSTVWGGNPALQNADLRGAPATPEDVYLEALTSGNTPFASKLSALLPMGHQAGYVAEMLELTMRASLDGSPVTQNEIRRLFEQAKAEIPESVFDPVDPVRAKAHWELIFTAQAGNEGRSAYLSQFMAAALTYPPLYEALQNIQTGKVTPKVAPTTLAGKLALVMARILNALTHRITGTRTGQPGGSAVTTLAHHLATIEQKRRLALAQDQDTPGALLERLSEGTRNTVDKFNDKIRAKAEKVQDTAKSKVLQSIAGLTATYTGNRAEKFWDVMTDISNFMDKDNRRFGWFASTFNEARGVRDITKEIHILLDQANTREQMIKKVMTRTTAFAEESFVNEMSDHRSKSMTRIVLRGDLQSLIGRFQVSGIAELISDRRKLDKAVRDMEQELAGLKSKYEVAYINGAKALAYQMATGDVKHANLVLNANQIVTMAGTQFSGKLTQDEGNAAIDIIDPLVSLYFLQYSNKAMRDEVAKVAAEEAARTDNQNGFEMALLWHQKFVTGSAERIFKNDKYHMVKGYTRDITDPYKDLVVAEAKDGEQLKKAGYVEVTKEVMGMDIADTSDGRKLYVMSGKGLNNVQLGVITNTAEKSMGHVLHGPIIHPVTGQLNQRSQVINRRIQQRKRAEINRMMTDRNYDPSKELGTHSVPIFNGNGEAINYRYLMSDVVKDDVLMRDNRLAHVMGHMAGHTLNKETAPGQNRAGIDALHQQYLDTYATDSKAFVAFSADSPDPEIRERYRLMPDDAKRYMESVWGSKTMMVRKDTYDLAFGYRKYSLYDSFTMPPEERNFFEKVFLVPLLGDVVIHDDNGNVVRRLGSKGALRLLRTENAWQEIVKDIKDIIVIKNLWTLWGNELSNLSLLALSGVPLTSIIKNKIVAYRATGDYQRADTERANIETQLSIGYFRNGSEAALKNRLVELEDEIARNPIKVLVDGGMYQTLVEDIESEEDNNPYSYKSRLTKTIDKYTGADSNNRFVKDLRAVGKNVLMTHDTGLYKLLNKATILSDFTSRYVLYEHLTTRKKNPLNSKDALLQARESFVNYDIPTHRGTQYLNDMGLVWFTKYYLRIQAVIFNRVRENPLGVLGLMGMNEIFGAFPDVLDSSVWSRWPVNAGVGAFDWLSVQPEKLTLQILDSMAGLVGE